MCECVTVAVRYTLQTSLLRYTTCSARSVAGGINHNVRPHLIDGPTCAPAARKASTWMDDPSRVSRKSLKACTSIDTATGGRGAPREGRCNMWVPLRAHHFTAPMVGQQQVQESKQLARTKHLHVSHSDGIPLRHHVCSATFGTTKTARDWRLPGYTLPKVHAGTAPDNRPGNARCHVPAHK